MWTIGKQFMGKLSILPLTEKLERSLVVLNPNLAFLLTFHMSQEVHIRDGELREIVFFFFVKLIGMCDSNKNWVANPT